MRFKTGDKVEVMNNKEVPISWVPAEVLSARGHAYSVQYDYHPGIARDRLVEMVPRRLIRPCPPPVQGVESFYTGDIVEVFYRYSWKIAAFLNILEDRKESKKTKTYVNVASFQNQYLVRLLGCSQELVVDRSIIRMRQTWRDNKWIIMGKCLRAGDDVLASKPSTSNCCRKMQFKVRQVEARVHNRSKKDCDNIHYDAAFRESPVISSRSLKRTSPYESSIIEPHNGRAQKRRATEKEGLKQRVIADPVHEKVDAVAYPKETLGEKYMHSSYKILSHGYNQMERENQNDVIGYYSGARSSEINSSDSDACSVGSCSVNNQGPSTCYIDFMPVHCQETDTLCSDAESSYGSGSERKGVSLPPKEELEVSIRRLELHAYRSTLEALYASGPLSWEQEALLTNLRIMLHISNDEHLKELKHLISTNTAISVR